MLHDPGLSTEMGPQGEVQEVRFLPHNIEAEQELLGALMLNNNALDHVNDFLKHEHFFDFLHQRIYQAIKKRILAGQKADPITLKSTFENEEPLGSITVPQYLGKLVANATSIINAKDYGETIIELFRRREIIIIGEQMSKDGFATEEDVSSKTLIEETQRSLDALQDHGGSGQDTCRELGDSSAQLIESLLDETPHDCVSTGLKALDDKLCGGWQKGELHIVGGRSSMGKSAFIVSSLLKSAREGYECLCFSLEMTHAALAARCLSDMTYTKDNFISYSNILKKEVESYHIPRLQEASQYFQGLPLLIDDQRGISVSNIHSRVRKYINELDKSGRKLDLLVVDHLGLVKTTSNKQRHLELGDITDDLATIAKDYNIAVVVLCQLNRSLESRDNKRPELHDLRNSGEIEENSACVLGLYRPAYYLEKTKHDDMDKELDRKEQLKKVQNDYEVHVLKQRNGPLGEVKLSCHMPTNSIGNRGRY